MNLSIDPELAIEYGNQIIASAQSYNKEIDDVYSIVNDLKKNWTGSAAQRFTDNIDSFKDEYQEFGKLINSFGELLVAIGKDYKDLEENL